MIKKLLILGIVVTIVGGTVTERQSLLGRRMDPYTIEVYRYGIALNNENRLFYNITPYNYFVGTAEDRAQLLSWDENISPNEFEIGQRFPYKQLHPILNFFNTANPSATFKTEMPVTMSTKINGREINIATEFEVPFESLTQSISFNDSDMVFSSNYGVFTEISDLELEEFSRFYGVQFTRTQSNIVEGNFVIITNPQIGGAILVDLTKFDSAVINIPSKLIELTSSNNDQTIKLEIYNNLQEVINATK